MLNNLQFKSSDQGQLFERKFPQNFAAEEPLLEVIVNGKTLSACSNVQQCFLRRTNGEPDSDAVAPRMLDH